MKKPLVIIVTIGVILRIWGIGFGLPYQFHQDEPIVVNHALAYGTGDLNPHFFAIPPLTSYLLFIVYALYFVFGKITGLFFSPESFVLHFFQDPTAFYLLGRIFIGVIPGALCIILTWILYRRIFSSGPGAIFAAAVMSFSFLNVINSHYIYPDMLMIMFVILSVIAIFGIYRLPSSKNYYIAALSIGCATAVKYNTALLIAPFLLAHLLVCNGRAHNKKIMTGLALMVATFFILNPFALLDAKFFINAILKQSGAESFTGWAHHVKYSLSESVGPIVLISGFLGLLVAAAKDRAKGAILISFPAVFFLHIVFFGQQFARYAIPLIPFLALGSGYILFEFIMPKIKSGRMRTIFLSVCFLIFIPLIIKSVKADSLFASRDTRVEAAEWIGNNLPADSRIAVDNSFFRPAIRQNKKQLMDKIQADDSLKAKKTELMIKALGDKNSYYLYFLSPHPSESGRFMSTLPAFPFDLDVLRKNKVAYITVNYMDRQQGTEAFYEELANRAVLVASFSPYLDNKIRMSYDEWETTGFPVLSKEVYGRDRTGPAIEIYELKR